MSLRELAVSERITGLAKVRKSLLQGKVRKLFVAADADPRLVEPLVQEAESLGIPVETAENRKKLGRACAIDCGAAAAALLRGRAS